MRLHKVFWLDHFLEAGHDTSEPFVVRPGMFSDVVVTDQKFLLVSSCIWVRKTGLPPEAVPAATSGVPAKFHQRVPVLEVGEHGDDEEGAEHRDGADDEERFVALVLPDDVGQDAQGNGQTDCQSRHLEKKPRKEVSGDS